MLRRTALAGLATLLLFGAEPVSSQDSFPWCSVVLVVPYAPGGARDINGRVVAEQLTEALASVLWWRTWPWQLEVWRVAVRVGADSRGNCRHHPSHEAIGCLPADPTRHDDEVMGSINPDQVQAHAESKEACGWS